MLRLTGLIVAVLLLTACEDSAVPDQEIAAFQGGRVEGGAAQPLGLEAFKPLLRSAVVPGVSLHHIADPRGQMAVAVVDLQSFTGNIVGVDTHPQGVSTATVLEDPGVAVLIGSGFVTELNALTPVGLLQIDGRVVSKIQRHGYTRVLGIDAHRIGVVDHLNFERGLFPSALQAGPGVVEAGQLDIAERDLQRVPYFRALVGACDGQGLLAASLTPMHLYSAGQLILEFAERNALACDEVVNLAGDREALLAVRTPDGDAVYIGNPRTRKAAIITFSR